MAVELPASLIDDPYFDPIWDTEPVSPPSALDIPGYVRAPRRGQQYWEEDYRGGPSPEEIARATVIPPTGIWDPNAGLIPLSKLAPTARTVMDALDALASASPELSPEEAEQLIQRNVEPDPFAKAITGGTRSALKFGESMTSLANLTLLGGSAVTAGAPLLSRLLSAGFTADMLQHTPEAAQAFGRAYESGDPEAITEAGLDLAQNLGFAGATGFQSVRPRRVRIPESIRALEELNQLQREGAPNAIQERQAAEVLRDVSEQPGERPGPLPAQEGGGRVPPSDLPPGDQTRPPGAEEARASEVSLTHDPIPTDPVERANFEQDLIERGVASNTEQGLPREWRAATATEEQQGDRSVATVDEAGNVVIYRPMFRKWLADRKPADRIKAVQALFNEEGIHGVARKLITDETGQQRRVVTDEEAAGLYNSLSKPEQALLRKTYGEIRPEDVPPGASAEMMYGHEHLRRNMSRLLRQPVREVAESKGYQWLKESAIDMIERVILAARRTVGSKHSQQLDSMLNRLQDHIDAARKVKGMEPVDWQGRLEGAAPALEGAPRALEKAAGEEMAKEEPAKPEVARLTTSKYNNKQGDPIGTTYHATPEDWAKWQEQQANLSKFAKEGGDLGSPEGQALFKENERIKNKYGGMPPEAPKATPLVAGAPRATLKEAKDKFSELREKVRNAFATRENKQISSATKDAADNQARVMADQLRNGMVLEAKKAFPENSDEALNAVIAVIESGGDRTKLADFIRQSHGKPGSEKAVAAAGFAARNWDAMQPLADRFRADTADQRAMEQAAGISVEERQNYFPHMFDVSKLPGKGAEFFPSKGAGGGGGKFRARRAFNTIYDAIEAGYGDAIKSLNAADVLQARVQSGAQRVLDRAWVDSLRSLDDPTTGSPIVTSVRIDPNGVMLAPPGYEVKTVLNGPPVAVHQGYGKFIDALTGASQVSALEVMGLPVGEALLKTEAAIKHGTLLFDTFHASRMMQKASFLSPKQFAAQLLNPKRFGQKGVSLLEYADRDLAEAVRQGEISPQIAQWVRNNRPNAQLLIKRGLNVGQIQEALRADIIKEIPVLGKFLSGFNGWVFQKVTRGAMMEGALIELDRVQKANPTWSREKVADKVAKDLNAYFGNLGRQGIFKSRTFQDLSRLILLAPNWFESMARSEAYGYGQLGKAAISTAKGEPKLGSVGKGMANGLLAYFIGTQILNLITRGQPTWKNEEEGHKMDAWIPDLGGKSGGFFISPMSVPAEITHDFFKYRSKKHDDSAEGAFQIAKNKMSPLSRALYTMATGDTYKGKVTGTWNRAKAAALSLVPVPIAAGGFASDRPGQVQRQLSSTLGFKIDPAETTRQRINTLHSRWLANNPDPLVRADYEKNLGATYPVSQYRDLDRALDFGSKEDALKAIKQLQPLVKSDKVIYDRMRPFAGKGTRIHAKPLLQQSRELENKFLDSLDARGEALYEKAMEERQARWEKFLEIWGERDERPEPAEQP